MGTIPTASTVAAGAVATAAMLNQYKTVLDFWASPPSCYAYQSVSQSVPNSTATAIQMAAELYDVVQSGDSPNHDNVTNNTRLTCRTAGKYEIVGQIGWLVSGTGTREARIRLNGTTDLIKNQQSPLASARTDCACPVIVVTLAVGDYVELVGFQSSGGALSIQQGQEITFLRWRLVAS